MIIYSVEGDQEHLMNEEMGHHKFRVAVRGSCVSYQKPWEEILEQINKHRADRNVLDIPRPQDCLKYMLRVQLQG
eukprot:3936880-Karenia_brevis.AAC.1